MAKTVINHHPAPDPATDTITLPFGVLTITGKDGARISTITYNPGEPVHRHYPLKAKHRSR